MTLSRLLRELVDAFGYLPYDELSITWHPHLGLWSASFSYWQIRPGFASHPWGKTPEEAVRKFCAGLKGQELYRTGQNGNWGRYEVKEEITCDDVAFTAPVPALPLVDGHNEVFPETAILLAQNAGKVFLKTFIGDRYVKGVPDSEMIEPDRGGKGFGKLLESLEKAQRDHPIEVGYYDGGKRIGFRGGLL